MQQGGKLVKENLRDVLQPRSSEEISTDWENLKQEAKEKLIVSNRDDIWEFMEKFFYRWDDEREKNTDLEDFLYFNLKHSQLRDGALELLKDMNDYGFDDEDNYELLNNFIKEK